jgi:alpha-1,4-digalacturonate transport system permease protein
MPSLIVVGIGTDPAVQIFDEVFVLTGGGPGSATTFIVQFIYQTGFAESIHQYGLAAAIPGARLAARAHAAANG